MNNFLQMLPCKLVKAYDQGPIYLHWDRMGSTRSEYMVVRLTFYQLTWAEHRTLYKVYIWC